MHNTLYELVMNLCEKKKVSIYQMCSDIEIPKSSVYTWKNRHDAAPSLDVAIRLSNYFGVPVECFNIQKE